MPSGPASSSVPSTANAAATSAAAKAAPKKTLRAMTQEQMQQRSQNERSNNEEEKKSVAQAIKARIGPPQNYSPTMVEDDDALGSKHLC